METFLDIAIIQKEPIAKIYKIETLEDVANAIKDSLLTNSTSDFIRVDISKNVDIREWKNRKGIIFRTRGNSSDKYIQFRGFHYWVYFLDDKPVFFDEDCCATDTPPHTSTFRNEIYKTLKFDSYRKISF